MSIEFVCRCGAVIRVAERYAARRARCKACGAALVIPEHPAAQVIEEDGQRSSEQALSQAAKPPQAGLDPVQRDTVSSGYRLDRDAVEAGDTPFWKDAAKSFAFFADPGNAASFLFVWLLYAAYGFLGPWPIYWSLWGLISLITKLFCLMLLSAFYLNTVTDTARGEDELPAMWARDLTEDLVKPLVLFFASWIVVVLPGALCALLLPTSLPGLGRPALLISIAIVCTFFWPALILMLSIGGITALRPIMLVQTVARSLVPYLAIWLFLAIAAGATYGLIALIGGGRPGIPGLPVARGPLLVRLPTAALQAYLMVVTMRFVGLYYRHFKDRFPWIAE